MRPLVIVGAGGQGREMRDTVEAVNGVEPTHEFLGFLADEGDVLGPVDQLTELEADYLIGIGDPEARRRVDALAADAGREAPVLVHPSAQVGSDVRLAPGAYLGPGVVITTNVRVGRHTIVNVAATLAHDVVVGDFVTIGPGSHLAGGVCVEHGADLGVGVVVRPGCRIGAGTVVGAGAVVVSDLPDGVVAMGVPAKPRHSH